MWGCSEMLGKKVLPEEISGLATLELAPSTPRGSGREASSPTLSRGRSLGPHSPLKSPEGYAELLVYPLQSSARLGEAQGLWGSCLM